MIPVPHTYAEWINLLACFTQRENDEDSAFGNAIGNVGMAVGCRRTFFKKIN